MTIYISLGAFLAAFLFLLWLLRHDRISLGLPLAYFLALSLEHVPGAYAAVASGGMFGSVAVERGFSLAAIGACCFVGGVWLVRSTTPFLARRFGGKASKSPKTAAGSAPQRPQAARSTFFHGPNFWLFCIVGGWSLIYGVSAVLRLPSVGAIVEKGGAIWMLGVSLGLMNALRRKDMVAGIWWFSALMVYPALMLILGGFMSYGSAAVIITCSALAIAARSYWKVIGVVALSSFLSLSIFVNYFEGRTALRNTVWSGASIDKRLDVVEGIVLNSKFFSAKNPSHLKALDERLNQNFFVGTAAERLDDGLVDYLDGDSLWQGVIAVVPRALWPEKPVFGGSPEIVRRMTGLNLAQNTSWGVGQVMEFYINYAMWGLVIGFLALGALLGWLDRRAATSLQGAVPGQVFLYYLPAVALIQPIGSLVELTGGAGAGLAAAFLWREVWKMIVAQKAREAQLAQLLARQR